MQPIQLLTNETYKYYEHENLMQNTSIPYGQLDVVPSVNDLNNIF